MRCSDRKTHCLSRTRVDQVSSRSGFTLVELVAASLVMSMLLMVLVSVTRSGDRQSRRARALQRSHPSVSILKDQIVRDVRNADGMRITAAGVELFGALATDPGTGAGTHQPAYVAYVVRSAGSRRVLMRTERTPRGAERSQLAWMDCGGLQLSAAGSFVSVTAAVSGSLPPIPEVVTVELFNSEGQAILQERIRHHREVR